MEHTKEPEWTAENMNREKGDTTFEICGWCDHASCGSCRYGCYLSTSCSLCKSYGIGSDVAWDTPCIVKSLGIEDFESIIASKLRSVIESDGVIERLKNEIATLNKLSAKAESTPPLPYNRVYDYYTVGEVLRVFFEGKWNKGVCVSGYRHHDGCVSYVLDSYPKSKEGWGCGCAVPSVLKDWEYKYFKSYLEPFRRWLDLSDKNYNGEKLDIASYLLAIQTDVTN